MLVLWVIIAVYLKEVTSYFEDYKAFDDCGINGWTCSRDGSDLTVTYRCPRAQDGARLWWWTARIPATATVLAVENCKHVEIHPDCTTGYRSYVLKEFRAKNIEHLELLEPILPRVFLHDNERQSHAPQSLAFINISKMTFTDNIFVEGSAPCRTKQLHLQKLSFDEVSMDTAPNVSLNIQSFSMNRVNLSLTHQMHIWAKDYINIFDSELGSIFGMILKGKKVTLARNNILTIAFLGIHVLVADTFTFKDNKVHQVDSNGFNVVGETVVIERNTWGVIKSAAFSQIAPGYYNHGHKTATKFSYLFTNNTILVLEAGAVAPDYQKYQQICANITLKDNRFPCECPEWMWTPSMNPGENIPFYDLLTYSQNSCLENEECQLEHAYNLYLRGHCNFNVTLLDVCNSTDVSNISALFASEDDQSVDYSAYSTDNDGTTYMPEITTFRPINNAVTQQSSNITAIITPFVIIFFLCSTVLGFVFYKKGYFNYFKRESDYRHNVMNFDTDSLIEERHITA